ncbi:transcription initiation protein [Ktedonobacter sp. SOSP1-52]|uniref:YciI family protein n=1 Tax=Ktedonobacter sp. SOSP1-52 TaxID=2778366 RepID=UPI001916B45B|nr:YciI family protein [Ktedonobacter sp. SOSP1-52]GHO63720.1 transcription initiation protein [Ktedonobacter sp. SOSP1-52]
MKYLLLFCATQEELAAWQTLPEEERARTYARSAQWMNEHRAQIRSNYGLYLPHTVTSVHVGVGGQPLVTDGPFLEGTEVIGGYAVIEVTDLDEALQLAKTWAEHMPAHPVVEIWPVVEE